MIKISLGANRYSSNQKIKEKAAQYLSFLDCYGQIEKQKLNKIEEAFRKNADILSALVVDLLITNIVNDLGASKFSLEASRKEYLVKEIKCILNEFLNK